MCLQFERLPWRFAIETMTAFVLDGYLSAGNIVAAVLEAQGAS